MLKQFRPAVIGVMLFTLVGCAFYPLVVTAIAQACFPYQANGSLIYDKAGKTVVGSELIAQGFVAPGYFHPRQSAAGNGYDPTSSGGTNLGPTSDKLINGIHKKLPNGGDDPGNFDGIKDLAAAYRKENNLAPDAPVPADAATRSASGLDPEISPANAALQAPRVAKQRGMTIDAVQALVDKNTAGRALGIFGEPRVNVLKLNLALDDAAPGTSGAGKSGATPSK